MLYGLNKISVLSGHKPGDNIIPDEFVTTDAEDSYSEGTMMYELADFLNNIDGVTNVRSGSLEDLTYSERASRMLDSGADLCLALHTNWSVTNGAPNSGVLLIIIPMYNPIHNEAEQRDMAKKIFEPLAEKLKLTLKISTKQGSGEWDWYSYLNSCNYRGIPYPMIVECGYHPDFANNEKLFKTEFYKNLQRVCEDVNSVPEIDYGVYKVYNQGGSSLRGYKVVKEWAGGEYFSNGTLVDETSIEVINGTEWLYGKVQNDDFIGYFDMGHMILDHFVYKYDDIDEPVIPEEDNKEEVNVMVVKRVYGNTLYDTAIKVSQHDWEQYDNPVIVATGENYPDAICVTAKTAQYGYPVLFTEKDRLPDVVADEIKRLDPSHIIIIGGSGAVSSAVQREIEKL